ncbi:MAG: DUF1571 domain-containing protein [Flavobacteriales bacterium]|nr:DUF1571 domain-containing protein [Flavobacteriales bacterium]
MKILLISLLLIVSSIGSTQEVSEILNKMMENAQKSQRLKIDVEINERIEGKLKTQRSTTFVRYEPMAVYMKQKSPKKGLEVLFIEGENNNNALINPNGFPWVNVSLNPHGNMMHEESHHAIVNSGFRYLSSLIKNTLENPELNMTINYLGLNDWKGSKVHKIELINNDFRFLDYQITEEGEHQLFNIAMKYYINEYMILENNDNIDDFEEELSEGTIIKIPNSYGKRIVLMVEDGTFVPRYVEVHDNQGLFEKYVYDNVRIDAPMRPGEFTKECKEYGF